MATGAAPAERPARAPSRKQVACRGCGAVLQVDTGRRTATCPYCDSHAVVERGASAAPAPAFALGFHVGHERAAKVVRRWIGSRGFFARSDFKRAAVRKTRGVYVPAYLYGARAESRYRAQIGEEYRATTIEDGAVKRETRTEWRTLEGRHACYVQDVMVSASKGLCNQELEQLEPFDLGELRRYAPEIVSGWEAEEPTRSREEGFRLAHDEAVAKVGRRLGTFLPGDRQRRLVHKTQLFEETVDLVLLPVWSFAARYHAEKPPVRILVNGQTGEVHGAVPRSWLKIALAAVGGALLAGGLAFAAWWGLDAAGALGPTP